MKIQLEEVIPGKGQSFKIFTPRLKSYFYWHYHPEFELTFVEAFCLRDHVLLTACDRLKRGLLLSSPVPPGE